MSPTARGTTCDNHVSTACYVSIYCKVTMYSIHRFGTSSTRENFNLYVIHVRVSVNLFTCSWPHPFGRCSIARSPSPLLGRKLCVHGSSLPAGVKVVGGVELTRLASSSSSSYSRLSISSSYPPSSPSSLLLLGKILP